VSHLSIRYNFLQIPFREEVLRTAAPNPHVFRFKLVVDGSEA
jgi:hypothetical protein